MSGKSNGANSGMFYEARAKGWYIHAWPQVPLCPSIKGIHPAYDNTKTGWGGYARNEYFGSKGTNGKWTGTEAKGFRIQVKSSQVRKPSSTVLYGDGSQYYFAPGAAWTKFTRVPHSGQGNFLYVDGHAKAHKMILSQATGEPEGSGTTTPWTNFHWRPDGSTNASGLPLDM